MTMQSADKHGLVNNVWAQLMLLTVVALILVVLHRDTSGNAKVRSAPYLRRLPSLANAWNSGCVAIVDRANRALREEAQRLLRVGRCNVEIYSTKAEIRRRTIASAHSFDTKFGDSGLIISRI
jgi:hypothetical protein